MGPGTTACRRSFHRRSRRVPPAAHRAPGGRSQVPQGSPAARAATVARAAPGPGRARRGGRGRGAAAWPAATAARSGRIPSRATGRASCPAAAPPISRPGSRSRAPAVSGTSLTGQHLTLAGYRGHVVVLNFWGSWCGPCRQEAPSLGALARYFQLAGVRFLGVDIQDTPSAGIAFLRTFRIGYPSLNDPNDEIALEFHGTVPPTAIPSTLLIDRSGRHRGQGGRRGDLRRPEEADHRGGRGQDHRKPEPKRAPGMTR